MARHREDVAEIRLRRMVVRPQSQHLLEILRSVLQTPGDHLAERQGAQAIQFERSIAMARCAVAIASSAHRVRSGR